jgi:hypothetical protein
LVERVGVIFGSQANIRTNRLAVEAALIKSLSFAFAVGVIASSASAMPLMPGHMLAPATDVVNVKIICEQDGVCYERGRRPVARWVYGSDAFHGPGPYTGPGYYGRPGQHWAWWGFLKF